MNKKIKVGLLFLIVLLQISTIVGGFYAYKQMRDRYWKLALSYKELVEETHGVHIDFCLPPNPFAPLNLIILLSLFLTTVLLVDQICSKE